MKAKFEIELDINEVRENLKDYIEELYKLKDLDKVTDAQIIEIMKNKKMFDDQYLLDAVDFDKLAEELKLEKVTEDLK